MEVAAAERAEGWIAHFTKKVGQSWREDVLCKGSHLPVKVPRDRLPLANASPQLSSDRQLESAYQDACEARSPLHITVLDVHFKKKMALSEHGHVLPR